MTLHAALLTPAPTIPRWMAAAIARAQASGRLRIVRHLEVEDGGPQGGDVERAALALQLRLERLAGEVVAVRDLCPDAISRRIGRHASPPELGPLDLCIDAGVAGSLAQGIPSRHGTVSVEFAGAPANVGLFRAMVERRFEASARLNAGGGSVALEHARFAPPERESLRAMSSSADRTASTLLAKALDRFASGEKPAPEAEMPAATAPLGPATVAAYAWRRGRSSARGRWLARRPGRYRLEQANWFLAYRTDATRFITNGASFGAEGLRFLLPPEDRCWADPCLVTVGGVDHLFFEDFCRERERGAIAWMRVDGRDGFGEPESVLVEPHHLSYPFVFAAEGEMFMIPESASDGTVSLYRADPFPLRWRREAVLLDDEPACDATIHRGDDGRWWIFATVGRDSRHHELHAYWAERIRGPWIGHAQNPVKLDARSSRPAGKLFRRNGRWIRPAQDCSATYGGAIALNELAHLTPEAYEERMIERLAPPWPGENLGMHTLAHSEGLEVIDGRVRGTPACRFPFTRDWAPAQPAATSSRAGPAWPAAAARLPRPRAAR